MHVYQGTHICMGPGAQLPVTVLKISQRHEQHGPASNNETHMHFTRNPDCRICSLKQAREFLVRTFQDAVRVSMLTSGCRCLCTEHRLPDLLESSTKYETSA